VHNGSNSNYKLDSNYNNSKFASKKQSIGFFVNPNQKLSDLLNLNTQAVSNQGKFLSNASALQMKSGLMSHNEPLAINAVNHYTIPTAIEMMKSIQNEKADLPQVKK